MLSHEFLHGKYKHAQPRTYVENLAQAGTIQKSDDLRYATPRRRGSNPNDNGGAH